MSFLDISAFAAAPLARGSYLRRSLSACGCLAFLLLGVIAWATMMPTGAAGADASGQTLFEATAAGDVDAVRRMLDGGADPNVVDKDGVTPLYDAVLRGHLVVAEALLVRGARIDGMTADLGTPLVLSAHVGNVEAVRFLIDRGADVKRADARGTTILHVEAGWTDQPEIIDLLVAAGADVRARNDKGETPLFSAVVFENLANAERLLAAGAEINARDAKGRTPLHVAAKIGSERFVAYLLSRGAEVDAETAAGRTPLMSAVIFDNQAAAETLLAKGADRRRIAALEKSDYADKRVVAAYRNLIKGRRLMRDAVIARLRQLYHRNPPSTAP